jgi:hypothetical protein
MKIVAAIAGVVLALLGLLWLLQGLGLVTIPPVLCVAECAPLTGPSTQWAITGAVVLVVGCLALAFAFRRRKPD